MIYNPEDGGFGVSGRTVVAVQKLNPDGSNNGAAIVRFVAGADLNSSNMIYTVRASDLGITSATQKFSFSVYSFDNYFTGNLTDQITGMTHTLATPKFGNSAAALATPSNGSASMTVTDGGPAGAAASPSQTGFLLMHSNGKTSRESDVVTVTP